MQPLVGTLYQLIDQARSTPVRRFKGIVVPRNGDEKNKDVKKGSKKLRRKRMLQLSVTEQ